jgi:hypothetical protein
MPRHLSSLEPDDWKVLHQLDSSPKIDDPALKDIHELYGFSAIARTDDRGGYGLKPAPDDDVYTVIAFDQDLLPYERRVHESKPDGNNRVSVGDLAMFPAGRIIVQPNSKKGIAIAPRWIFAKEGQPAWIEKLRAADDRDNQQTHIFSYYDYLEMNQPNAIFVPAGVRLHIEFDLPYNDEWSIPVGTPEVQLGRGETLDLGELIIERSLAVTVLVVDEKDQPVEGIPVRRWYERVSGTVAHNTDAKGLAHFHIKPSAKGRFRITDFNDRRRTFPSVDFETEKKAPDKPIGTIKLNQNDIDALLHRRG